MHYLLSQKRFDGLDPWSIHRRQIQSQRQIQLQRLIRLHLQMSRQRFVQDDTDYSSDRRHWSVELKEAYNLMANHK